MNWRLEYRDKVGETCHFVAVTWSSGGRENSSITLIRKV